MYNFITILSIHVVKRVYHHLFTKSVLEMQKFSITFYPSIKSSIKYSHKEEQFVKLVILPV